MKRYLSALLTICTVALTATSCFDDDDDTTVIYPYAALKSFSIGSLKAYTRSTTAEGKDTLLSTTVNGYLYPFAIDQKNRVVYNPDSLPLGTDVSKVTTGVSCDGIAYIYEENDSVQMYNLLSSSDSLDFTTPRRLLVASTDGNYALEYTVSLNVHTVDPDAMYWEKLQPAPQVQPKRLLPFDGKMLLIGLMDDGTPASSFATIEEGIEWSSTVVLSLPETADLEAVQHFGNTLYVTAAGALYTSSDGENWNKANLAGNIEKLISASAAEGKMWAVVDGCLAYTTDGTSFVTVGDVPKDFPLHNVTSAVYPIVTNNNIIRSVLVGYPNVESKEPCVWSRLSVEDGWMQLIPSGGTEFSCPALHSLSMLRYDNRLLAFGRAGNADGTSIKAFSVLYFSRDNGLTWEPYDNGKMALPEALRGVDAPYASAVDAEQYLWIVTGGDNPSVWRGIINRLAF